MAAVNELRLYFQSNRKINSCDHIIHQNHYSYICACSCCPSQERAASSQPLSSAAILGSRRFFGRAALLRTDVQRLLARLENRAEHGSEGVVSARSGRVIRGVSADPAGSCVQLSRHLLSLPESGPVDLASNKLNKVLFTTTILKLVSCIMSRIIFSGVTAHQQRSYL